MVRDTLKTIPHTDYVQDLLDHPAAAAEAAKGRNGFLAVTISPRTGTESHGLNDIAFQCYNCRDVKRKCSDGVPCKPCVKKGIANTCVRATRKPRVKRARAHAHTAPSEPSGGYRF